MHKFGFLFLTLLLAMASLAQPRDFSDRQMLKSIKQGSTEMLELYLNDGCNANAILDNQKNTLLNYSIKYKNVGAVNLLLDKDTDVDLVSDGKTPLMFALNNDDDQIMNLLIRAGADLNATVKNDNTALIYAVKKRNLKNVRMLVEHGADVSFKNEKGMSALDYANMTNNVPMAEYLVYVIGMQHYYKDLPPYFDGPHMQWISDNLLRVFYMKYDTALHHFLMDEKILEADADTVEVQGFAGDTLSYTITRHFEPEPTHYKNVDKILAFGDVHGHYKALINYMKHQGIIDDKLQWNWGNGHVVLLGDVFDRGNEVTETLWFIYQLDQQARREGGKVHMLLGNHEVMMMLNDTRYLNRKYEIFSNYFMRDYTTFYDTLSVLGRWLHSRNTVITINDLLFSHAGISPELLKMGIPLAKINSVLLDYLNSDPDEPSKDAALMNLILNSQGPLWYRGYMMEGITGDLISQKDVERVLHYYNVDKIIIAHTEVKQLTAMYDGKVIAIDIPIRTSEMIPEALLIEEGRFYRLTIGGKIPCVDDYIEKARK